MTQPLLAAFFRRSAQSFFISSDKRRLPAAVRPRRRRTNSRSTTYLASTVRRYPLQYCDSLIEAALLGLQLRNDFCNVQVNLHNWNLSLRRSVPASSPPEPRHFILFGQQKKCQARHFKS